MVGGGGGGGGGGEEEHKYRCSAYLLLLGCLQRRLRGSRQGSGCGQGVFQGPVPSLVSPQGHTCLQEGGAKSLGGRG